MSERLQSLITLARAEPPPFQLSRSLDGALARKATRERRERVARRTVATLATGALFALLVIRASIAPASVSAAPVMEVPHQELASRVFDDGGFARD